MPKAISTNPERLLSLGLFEGLDADEVQRLAGGATEIPAPCGTVVFREGDACSGLYFVACGQVKLSLQTDRGQEKVVQLVADGECFDESALFLGQHHILTAEAIADTTLLHVAKEAVLSELGRSPGFGGRVIRELCRQLRRRTIDLQGHMLFSGTQRVVSYLLSRVPAGANGSGAAIALPAKKGIIASSLNLTHEHFSRILRVLVLAGLIQVEGRDVHIPDVTRLRAQLPRA